MADYEIIKSYKEFVASHITETFRKMDKGTSPEIRARVQMTDPAKVFLIFYKKQAAEFPLLLHF